MLERNTMTEFESDNTAPAEDSISSPVNQIQMIPLPEPQEQQQQQKKKRNLPGMPGNFIETQYLI